MLRFINDIQVLLALFGSDDPFSSSGEFRPYPGDYETIGIPFSFSDVIFWIVIGFIILFLLGMLLQFCKFMAPVYNECNKFAHSAIMNGEHALTIYKTALTAMKSKEYVNNQIQDNVKPLLSIFRPGGVDGIQGGADRPCVIIPQQQPERITEVANKVIESISLAPEITLKDCANQHKEFLASKESFGETRDKFGYWPFSYLIHIVQTYNVNVLFKNVERERNDLDKQIDELKKKIVQGINEAIETENQKVLNNNNQTQQANNQTQQANNQPTTNNVDVDANKQSVNDDKSGNAPQVNGNPAPAPFSVRKKRN